MARTPSRKKELEREFRREVLRQWEAGIEHPLTKTERFWNQVLKDEGLGLEAGLKVGREPLVYVSPEALQAIVEARQEPTVPQECYVGICDHPECAEDAQTRRGKA